MALRRNVGVAAATLILCVSFILVLDHGRGIWLDEATSYWLSGHGVGFAELIGQRWITDIHPPLYSAYAWMMQPLFGGSVKEMRLINLAGLFYAAFVWRQAWRRGVDRDFLMLFAVLVASSPFFILYAAEFRSYFFQIVLGACLIVQLRMTHEGRGSLAVLVPTALLLINLHYFGSLTGMILIAAEAIHLACSRRRRDAAALALIILVSLVPLAVSLIAMLAAIEPVAVNVISPLGGIIAIAAIAGGAVLPNLVAMMLSLRTKRPAGDATSFARMLAMALAVVVLTYFALNLATRNLLPRHMIAAVPIAAALVALLLERRVKQDGAAFALICVNAALLAAATTLYGLGHKRWETNAGLIEESKARCSQTRLYALNAMRLLGPRDSLHNVPGIDHFFGLTYQLVADEIGLSVTIVPDDKPVTPSGPCATLLWAEHLYAKPGITDAQLAKAAGFGELVGIERLQRDDSRALLAIHPAR